MRNLPALTALASCALLTACGGVSEDNFCEKFSDAYCSTSKACCTTQEVNVDQCKTQLSGFCQSFLIAPVKGGKATFDSDAAKDCINEVQGLQSSCPGQDGTGGGTT